MGIYFSRACYRLGIDSSLKKILGKINRLGNKKNAAAWDASQDASFDRLLKIFRLAKTILFSVSPLERGCVFVSVRS